MAEFVKVAKKSEIPDDCGKLVQAKGLSIALFKVDGGVHAIASTCPHQGGPLDEGGLDGSIVTCPWHGWDFDVKTGACSFNPSIKTQTFRVKEEGDDVCVEV